LALVGGLAVGLEKSARAAMEGQADQARLDAALTQTGQSLKAMAPALEAAESASRKLGFADNDTRLALARLEVATGNTKDAVKDLALAEDISRLKKVDLATATQTLSSTLGGNARAAKSLGIILLPVTSHMDALKEKFKALGQSIPVADKAQASFLDKQATAAKAIQAVTDKVGGQAAAFADTAQGGAAKFGAEMQRLEEVFGNMLLPAIAAVTEKLASFAQFLSEHTTTAKVLVGAFGALATALIAVSVAQSIATVATTAWSAATFVATGAMTALDAAIAASGVGAIAIALGIVIGALILAAFHFKGFRSDVLAVFSTLTNVTTAFGRFFTVTIPAAFETVLGWVRGNWPVIAVLVSGPFAPLVALATDAFGVRSALVGAFHSVLASAENTWGNVADAVSGAMNRVRNVVTNVWNVIKAIIAAAEKVIAAEVGGIVADFQAVVGVLQTVESAAQAAVGWLEKVASAGSAVGGVAHAVGSVVGKVIPHAAGGPVSSGGSYWVGERGPELFIPSMSGSIIPNRASVAAVGGGGGGGTVNYNISFPNYVGSKQELQQAVVSAIVQASRTGSLRNSDIRG
jgi:hypothetical protein